MSYDKNRKLVKCKAQPVSRLSKSVIRAIFQHFSRMEICSQHTHNFKETSLRLCLLHHSAQFKVSIMTYWEIIELFMISNDFDLGQ